MTSAPAPPSTSALRRRLSEVMLRDQRRLGRRLDRVRRSGDRTTRVQALADLEKELAAAEQRITRRRSAVPPASYPDQLPVSRRRDDIAAAIRDHQVVIVAGETGSGKTTQLPKICLELGRGVLGMIGHTQPRRLAARTVAERISEELDRPLGEAVGYQVRFTDKVSDDTLVKLMTDGILLTEIQRDRSLRAYDTIIIDEAHERSLNIDFILGYLRQLLPRRPDLKVVITSATIDPERFARHFGDAPVVEVSGRTYPVEVRYRPLVEEGQDEDRPGRSDRDQVQAISDAVDELYAEPRGDILVFLSGEREIRDTADFLRKRRLRDTEVLPLYARLSAAEQHQVFQPHAGRRIVLATNVAETSLTVPGIRYVVDPGTARISRYSQRTKVQRLPIEPVSQASANQRAGRCGRVADGICIRLYSEEDYLSRPEFTDPEIVRTNLASVILQMTALGLGEIEAFPFVDPPDHRQIRDGVQLLHELGALDVEAKDPRKRLTRIGRQLVQIPLDPRIGRMLLEADRLGCLREVLVIASALSIQDPRERPAERQQAADQSHARFADPDSDFSAYLHLWQHLRDQQRALTSSKFRRMCRDEFLNYLRVREWQDLHGQLRQVVQTLGGTVNKTPADAARVHQAVLSGLLSHLGLFDPDKRDYLGARGARFAIFPGSHLFKRSPKWVVAAELVETTRLWARTVAKVDPLWAEELGAHLIRRTYSEPHWEKKRGAVMAREKVTLYGVPLVAARTVSYGRIDRALSRELFIRHALVYGEWDTRHEFFHANRRLVAEVEELEDRSRRRDILVDEEVLFDFYDQRVGEDVVSAAHFDTWWKKTRRSRPDLLDFELEVLVRAEAEQVSEEDFPATWRQGDLALDLTYVFDPGSDADGVTVHIPVALLNQVETRGFDWQVPGLREELATALIRSLPKQLRRNFIPAPDRARAALARIEPSDRPLVEALGSELHRETGVPVPVEGWRPAEVPAHLRMTFRVEDDDGRVLGVDKDLEALRRRLQPRTRSRLSKAAKAIERTGMREWPGGSIPRRFTESADGQELVGFPALVDSGETVELRVLDSAEAQRREMWRGTRRLLQLALASPVRWVQSKLDNHAKLSLGHNPHGGVPALMEDCLAASVDALVAQNGGPVWDAAAFAVLRDKVRADLHDTMLDVVRQVARILSMAHALRRRLEHMGPAPLQPAVADIRAQLDGLVYSGFVTSTGASRLPDVVRYLRAIEHRLDRLPTSVQRDLQEMHRIHALEDALDERLESLPGAGDTDNTDVPESLHEVRWMIEELRVSVFAQQLGTRYPISDKRVRRALERA
ncbi:MAG TPA: ATP-dependent RNA helicase HrpA [Nocardioidaceae bacterium]|nr:ATP-dependent RNA helicase HrpA [Nocardioidaceae bacterium]